MILHSLLCGAAYIRKPRLGTCWQNALLNHAVTGKFNSFSGERKETGYVFK